ncbi:MAG: 4Fe-4S binding protein [Candidatus Zhuqueibacterota bacterium]
MFELLKLRKQHGYQAIPDIRQAQLPEIFRGFPLLNERKCQKNCQVCVEACPTGAITLHPLQLDLGKCIFCGECQRVCSANAIQFTHNHLLGAANRDALSIVSGMTAEFYEEAAITTHEEIKRLFGRSLKLRQVSAGGCNGCEMELTAAGNVNFDMRRFGINFVASPRHSDGIVITGPITKNMAPALIDAYHSVNEPRIVIAVGACAISAGIFSESPELNRDFLNHFHVDLYIPGCPPHPLTFIRAVLKLIG